MQEIQPGTTLEGRYRLVSEAAPHDLGNLYRGYDTVDDELVMILILPYEITAGSEVLSRLSRAQRAIAALGAEGLVSYEYGGIAEDRLYLVRRHMTGRPLADLLVDGPLDPTIAATITIGLSELVSLLHRAGIVHGSLSPYCIYVDSSAASASVSITDSGLLPALRDVQSMPGGPWGRPPYLSPEQAAGEEIHPASDVYVVGSLLYAMLAGRPPFRAADETVLVVQHLRQQPPALDVLMPDLPQAPIQIVHKALAKEPAARYRNAGQLAQILRSQMGLPAEGAGPPLAADPHLYVAAPPRRPLVSRVTTSQVDEAPGGIDWVMIALIVAALLAMLGLVWLWRTVYDRYTGATAAMPVVMRTAVAADLVDSGREGSEAAAAYHLRGAAGRGSARCDRAAHLPRGAKSWMIAPLSGIIHALRDTRAGPAVRDRGPGYGVKITGFAASLC